MRAPLTLSEIAERVEEIRAHVRLGDYDAANTREVELFEDALIAVSEHHPISAEVAKAALKSRTIDFPRGG